MAVTLQDFKDSSIIDRFQKLQNDNQTKRQDFQDQSSEMTYKQQLPQKRTKQQIIDDARKSGTPIVFTAEEETREPFGTPMFWAYAGLATCKKPLIYFIQFVHYLRE